MERSAAIEEFERVVEQVGIETRRAEGPRPLIDRRPLVTRLDPVETARLLVGDQVADLLEQRIEQARKAAAD